MIKKKTVNKRPPKKIENSTKTPPKKVVKKEDNRYVKVFANESLKRFKEIGEQVFKKELKWSYYAVEDLIGVHYYLKLKKKK